jgi:hypothetical protein
MNPWTDLPASAPFLLPIDVEAVERFNAKASRDHAVHLEIVPEPFLGNPLAPVVLLNLNPGFVETDLTVHLDPAFNAGAVANLRHQHPEYPLYLLDPAFPSPGQDWWKRKLRVLIEEVGLRAVASNLFVVEIHGYHSRKYSGALRLPSQPYTRELVLAAIARQATIVVMRGRRAWNALVPELSGLTSIAFLRNVQNPTISLGNCPDSFARILAAVKTAT